MSGGSYDYAFRAVRDMAETLESRTANPLRLAFARHLHLVSQAMHDIEWVDSCDYGKGQEDAAIRAVIAPDAEVNAALELAETARRKLDDAIHHARLMLAEGRNQ